MIDKKRFITLWTDLTLPNTAAKADAVFNVLDELYREDSRYYHTWGHITQLLLDFDLVQSHFHNPNAVEMAIWFHDAIYEMGASDNERRSADLFLSLSEGILDERMRAYIDDLIMVTVHSRCPELHDGQMLVDIDLLSFGSESERFWRDNQNVRKEAQRQSDDEFYPKQIAFLKHLLSRDKLYYSGYFHQRYEDTARHNINIYLESLQERGYTV